MTREEVEARVYEKIQEIVAICKEYDPEFNYITLYYIDGTISFNNEYWEADRPPINYRQEGGEEDE